MPEYEAYVIITWPETQELMDKPGFEENACLANSEYFIEKYGLSAYFVSVNWLNELNL